MATWYGSEESGARKKILEVLPSLSKPLDSSGGYIMTKLEMVYSVYH
jgi:hypothetical protein